MWVVLLALLASPLQARPQQQDGRQQHREQHREQQPELHQLQQQALAPLHVQARDINVVNEPTCDELKAMWRFSKRQARTPEIINEISTYKDPFSYNEWAPYYGNTNGGYVSSSRSAGGSGGTRYRTGSSRRPVFGRVVHKAPLSAAAGFAAHGGRGYDQVVRLYGAVQGEGASRRPSVLRLPGGGVPAQTGRFQHLKEIIRTERARELQQQRAAEELAARAAALKEIAGGQRFREEYHGHKHREYLRAPWGNSQDGYMSDDPNYYHTARDRYSGDSSGQQHPADGMIAYPDLLAPPARRAALWQRAPPLLRTADARSDLEADYATDPILLDEALYEPFPFNLHDNFGRSFFDEHAIRRSDGPQGLVFN